MNIPGYDAWKLETPWDDMPEVGREEGDTCGRWQEPDEDYPRPRRCDGEMMSEEGVIYCDTCRAIA